MKRLLNTLYITAQETYLARDGETIAVRVEKETRLRVPVHTLGGVVCFGVVNCSPAMMGLCAEHGVTISFLTEYGRFLARVEGPVSGNVLLRRAQYRIADQRDIAASIARSTVAAKIANCRTVLLRTAREHACPEAARRLGDAAGGLARSIDSLSVPASLDTIRGIEGDAARMYFGVFDDLITANKEGFRFTSRSRRPPLDPVNALLSFIYTLLVHDARSALETVGLDPAVGFLHRDRPGRPGLALDLMEEFRPFMADRMVLTLINRQQVKTSGFTTTDSGAVLMDDDTRKTVLVAWQTRKQEEIMHPFIEERIPLGMVVHVQALLLARHIRGDLDAYPPFFWK